MKKKKESFSRYTALIIIMTILFTGIVSKLAYLQIVKAEEYSEKANTKAIAEIQEAAPRGYILDKNGEKLATNQQSHILTFAETDESKNAFFQTMNSVFKILDENGEVQKDDFELKVNPFRFEFKAQDDEGKRELEIRFKRDRGLNDDVKKKLFPKKKEKLTEDEEEKVNDELVKISPEDTFNFLIKQYGLDKLTDRKYTVEELRRYLLVKDAIKMQSFTGYKPVVIASNIKKDTAFILSQKSNDLPGIDVTMQPMREYPYGELASAVLGYTAKIGTDNGKYDEKGYDVGLDHVGISGIEGVFEDKLKGSKGGTVVKLNRQGRIFEELGSRESYPGQTIQLTIDKDVQYAAEVALDKVMKDLQGRGVQKDVNTSNATRGAAVAIDVNTGAILALASRPGFDPNDFAKGLTTEQYKKYFSPDYVAFGKSKGYGDDMINKLFPLVKGTSIRKDEYGILPQPLFNYATQSLTPPGSTFKPMTAVAGLETGVITPHDTVNDAGYFDDGHNFHTTFPSNGSNGIVNLTIALEKSSNPYFMTVGQKLRETFKSDDKLAEYAWKFGLGVKPNSGIKPTTGIEITESFGQVFNSWSIKNSFSQTYLWKTMSVLKSGKSDRTGGTFPSIDLYDNVNDTDELKQIKTDFKKQIQEFIKTGGYTSNGDDGNKRDSNVLQICKDYLNKLIAADSQYKDKNISKTEINTISYEILQITIYDGNYQTQIGTNMYNASIGQGISNFTPLQLANYVSTLVNGGSRYKLHLVDKIMDPDGKVIENVKPEVVEKTGIKQETVEAVKAGMHAVTGEDGTAAGVFNGFPVDTAGKTGSATYRQNQEELGRTSYGVYVGFAPYDKPQIAVAVLVFDGGHGGFIAPVARAMYEAYFKDQLAAQGYIPQNDIVAKPIH